jgi:hypothetical protein
MLVWLDFLMGAVTDLLRLLGSAFVEQIARRLEREGSAKRAPNFTLIQVDASQTGLFETQISTIAKLFDRVLVAWPEPERPSRLPGNVEVFTAEGGVLFKNLGVERNGSSRSAVAPGYDGQRTRAVTFYFRSHTTI